MEWPPPAYQHAYQDMEVNDAWYSGDVDSLEMHYATTQAVRTAGFWGQAKRFFMGTPVPGQQSQRPVKLHVPIPSEISRMSSQILYGEMPKVELADLDEDGDAPKLPDGKRKAANSRLTDLLDDSAHASFLEGGELGSALGGSYLRVTWDRSIVPDRPFITAVAPDAAVPDFRFTRLVGVTFWSDLAPVDGTNGQYRLLERHEPGTIEWGLYLAVNKDQLGTRVPLTEHPATAGLADIVSEESTVETGSELLTAVYIPNVRPVRLRRKDPVASNFGRSDYEGVDSLFDALDEVYTSWMRDIRVAKSRIFVSRDVLDVGLPGQGATFDADREVLVPVKNPPGGFGSSAGGTPMQSLIEAQQFTIRWQEHQSTAKDILVQIFTACGYAPATFGISTDSVRTITATEVQAREKITSLTRGSKILYAKPQLQHLVAAMLDVDEYVFDGPGRSGQMPEVQFPDAAAPSIDAVAQTLQLLRAAEAASTETLVQMLNPDWEQDQIDAEVARIKAETTPTLPDPTSLTGADFAAGEPGGTGDRPGGEPGRGDGSGGGSDGAAVRDGAAGAAGSGDGSGQGGAR
jgi:hypothetical protein